MIDDATKATARQFENAQDDDLLTAMTPAQKAACLFALTQARASGKPQSEVNRIVRETLDRLRARGEE